VDQTEINDMLQRTKKYNAEKYLAEAAKLLLRNKNIKIEIATCEWAISRGSGRTILKIQYSANGHEVALNIVESVFKDYHRPIDDEKIGIKPDMNIKYKIILRLAYILYRHRED